jgi:hypothetical protein
MRRLIIGIAALCVTALAVSAQRRGRFGRERSADAPAENTPYDGRFTFARIRYTPLGSERGYYSRDVKWDHDYPRAERNFMKILREITELRPYMEGGNIFTADDPELMKYPIAYLCEPGFWTMSDKELTGLRAYLAKGGFLIFDDFYNQHWYNFEERLHQLLPNARLVQLDVTEPIFDSFFRIESIQMNHPYYGVPSVFYGVYEDNDPSKRLLMIINYNNDVGEYWEWSDEGGTFPIALTNEAYKLGVNYIIYGMTH